MLEASVFRRIEDRLRQDQAIGHNNRNIGVVIIEIRMEIGVLEAFGGQHRDPQRLCPGMNRAWAGFLPTPGRPRRLAIDSDNVMARGIECV